MQACMQAYDELLEDLIERMDGIFSDLPVDALDWTPDPAMNTLTILIVHTTGALRYWVGEMLGEEPAKRDRQTEFAAHGVSKVQLHALLNETQAQIERVLEKLTLDDLEKKRYSTVHKDYFTGAFALAHALEHTALHVGHMEITRELWEKFNWGRNSIPTSI